MLVPDFARECMDIIRTKLPDLPSLCFTQAAKSKFCTLSRRSGFVGKECWPERRPSMTVAEEISIFVDNKECTGVRVMEMNPPTTKIRFSMKPGVGQHKVLRLRNSAGLEGETKISYDKPIIQHCTRAPTSGGRISVTGLNFGTDVDLIKLSVGNAQSSVGSIRNEIQKNPSDSSGDTRKSPRSSKTGLNRIKMLRDTTLVLFSGAGLIYQ